MLRVRTGCLHRFKFGQPSLAPSGFSAFAPTLPSLLRRDVPHDPSSRIIGMSFGVLRFGECNQILRPVIVTFAVDVMDLLIRAQLAAVRLLPYKAVLKNITRFCSEVMVRHVDHHVATAVNIASAPPRAGFLGASGVLPWAMAWKIKGITGIKRIARTPVWIVFGDQFTATTSAGSSVWHSLRGMTLAPAAQAGAL